MPLGWNPFTSFFLFRMLCLEVTVASFLLPFAGPPGPIFTSSPSTSDLADEVLSLVSFVKRNLILHSEKKKRIKINGQQI